MSDSSVSRSAPGSAPARRSPAALALLAGLLAAGMVMAHPAMGATAVTTPPTRPVPDGSPSIFEIPAEPDPAYPLLDNLEGDWLNVVAWPVRPMAFVPDGTQLYAVNVYHNTIGHFDATLQRIDTFRTLWAPVSIATWVSPEDHLDGDQLLVVCHLSNAVVVHNRLTGDIIDVIDVPPQPADILVLPNENVAFVSTVAKDVVVEIDLLNRQVVAEYAIPSRQPTYLSLTRDGEVLVAPRWSGNNSAVHRHAGSSFNPEAGARSILDLADPAVATAPGLPDEDLFWLDRTAGQAVPIARGMGTLLFGHGVNPVTGAFWQLNTEADNKDPNKQSEPAIKGFISKNRLTRVTLPVLGSGTVVQPSAANITDLDRANPSGNHDPFLSVGTPYSLTFSNNGLGFLTGLLTDNVVVLGQNGGWLAEWDVHPGCIPRQVLLDPSQSFALVYCSGLNKIPVYFLNGVPPAFLGDLDLGYDPTPLDIQEGRRLFFDAAHSLNNNHSCATCHDEGRQDLLAWNLSNGHFDDKGPMVTQTLLGINRSKHFHWRGEQLNDLLDFNDAFVGLLGGTKLATGPGSAFEKFEKFVLSLEHPANPYQNRERILDDSIQPPPLSPIQTSNSSAINGSSIFIQVCEGCHHLPTGSSNDVIADGAVFLETRPKRQWIKVAPLWDVINKGLQPDVTVNLVGSGPQVYPRHGFGLAHAGNPRNTFHFVSFFFQNPVDPVAISDGTNFMFQYDSGLAPAAHAQQLMNQTNALAAQQVVATYMIPQANQRNSDLAVFGRATIGGVNRIWGWVWNRTTQRFVRDDNVSQQLGFFTTRAGTGEWFVFVGQPVGMGRLFATDFDRDELPNGLEQLTPADGRYLVDTDGDGDWDGHEWLNGGDPFDATVQSNDITQPAVLGGTPGASWTTAKAGRLNFETSELASYQLTLVPTLGGGILPTLSFAEPLPNRQHGLVMASMFPGVPYNATLTVTDLANLSQTYNFSVTPRPFTDLADPAIVTGLGWGVTAVSIPPGSVALTANVNVSKKTNLGPAPGQMVIGKVLLNGLPVAAGGSGASSFCVNGTEYTPANLINPVPGPFVISPTPTNASGNTTVSFNLSGLVSGDVITLTFEVVAPIHPTNPACPTLPGLPNLSSTPGIGIPFGWSFPDTGKPFRAIDFTYP